MRVKECQEGKDEDWKEDLGEVQCENPSCHMLHPASYTGLLHIFEVLEGLK